MIRALFSMYNPVAFATIVVYMLQNTAYRAGPYLAWFWRTQRFDKVMYRRQLDLTSIARALRAAVFAGLLAQYVTGVILLWWGVSETIPSDIFFGLALWVCAPLVWAHLVAVPLLLGRWLIVTPRDMRLIRRGEKIFRDHPGVKIAVVGSYGKTTMKELLKTVLSEGKKVAATPGNMNVPSSHAKFATRLDGDEDVLIIEFGEAKPGDVLRMAKLTHPTHAVITGLAPAHLDRYKTLARAGEDIVSIADYIDDSQKTYANADSPELVPFLTRHAGIRTYSTAKGVNGWKPKHVTVTAEDTAFELVKRSATLHLRTGLLGKHQVGPVAMAAALAHDLGLSNEQIEHGVANTTSFEHRMQPRPLAGAIIIDDTYNGNLEGVRAGTGLLATVKAKRKWYVTPGLVDQGRQTRQVHRELGELVAKASPDIVVLMQNSVTKYIQEGLEQAGFTGELRIESEPLEFYTNLEHFIAAGDVVLMQNDWTDNYA